MKITVINGTEKHGITYRLKETFLESFNDKAEIIEFYLPKDCPAFCVGCTACFMCGEESCKDASFVLPIWRAIEQADLLVFTTPAYVFHATGAIKALLDHFAVHWMPHRPSPLLFGKRAVIITQCLGAGAKSAAQDIKHSLSWWGVSKIKIVTVRLISDIVWEKLSDKKRNVLTGKLTRTARRLKRINYSKAAKTNITTKIKFNMCRLIQKSVRKKGIDGLDARYWNDHGWLGKKRPWKR